MEYFIHEVIVSDSNGKLYHYHSDWLNENFCFPQSGFKLENEIVRLIELAIAQAGGNISEAARILGVPRDYIRYRLKKKSN